MSFHPTMEYAPAKFHKSGRTLADEGPAFAYTPENQAKFDANVARYPSDQRKSAVLYALYLAQRQQGYLTAAAMRHVAQQIGCTAAEVEDVVSFYTMFYTRPVGRHVIGVCHNISCALRGAEEIFRQVCERAGVPERGGTSSDGRFTVKRVECQGACANAPMLDLDGAYCEDLDQARVEQILGNLS